MSSVGTGCQIEFKGRICRDTEVIATDWGDYFRELYSDTERPHFDSLFRNIVDTRVENILQELSTSPDSDSVTFTTDNIKKVMKACGKDGVYNEHLFHGSNTLCRELSVLFTDMYNNSFVPEHMKHGIIITLHKGDRKSKKRPK